MIIQNTVMELSVPSYLRGVYDIEKFTSQPKVVSKAFLTPNIECDIEFNVYSELDSNRKELESLEIKEIMDYNIKVNLCYERIELLKLQEITDELKQIAENNQIAEPEKTEQLKAEKEEKYVYTDNNGSFYNSELIGWYNEQRIAGLVY